MDSRQESRLLIFRLAGFQKAEHAANGPVGGMTIRRSEEVFLTNGGVFSHKRIHRFKIKKDPAENCRVLVDMRPSPDAEAQENISVIWPYFINTIFLI